MTETSLLYAGFKPSMELPNSVSNSSSESEAGAALEAAGTVSSLEMAEAGLLRRLKVVAAVSAPRLTAEAGLCLNSRRMLAW